MNDWEYADGYGSGFDDGKRQAEADKASIKLIKAILSASFKVLSFVILFCPGIFCAYVILDRLAGRTGDLKSWSYFLVFITVIYVLECLLFFLKGWFITLKEKCNLLWLIPGLICIMYCFALPVFMLHSFIFMMFKPAPDHPTNTLDIISWIVGVLIGIYIFSRYKLQSDEAPALMSWAYRLGRRISGSGDRGR